MTMFTWFSDTQLNKMPDEINGTIGTTSAIPRVLEKMKFLGGGINMMSHLKRILNDNLFLKIRPLSPCAIRNGKNTILCPKHMALHHIISN